MESAHRGRSLIAEQEHSIRQSLSRSPHNNNAAFNERANAFGIDPRMNAIMGNNAQQATPFTDTSFLNPAMPQHSYPDEATLENDTWSPSNQSYLPSSVHSQSQFARVHATTYPADNDLSPNSLDQILALNGTIDSPGYFNTINTQMQSQEQQQQQWSESAATNTASFGTNGMPMLPSTQTPDSSYSNATRQGRSGSNPHNTRISSFQPEALHVSQFANTNTLDPLMATNMRSDWSGESFTAHRRTLSDNYSDISSHPASPFINAADNLDPSSFDSALFPDPIPLELLDLNLSLPSAAAGPDHTNGMGRGTTAMNNASSNVFGIRGMDDIDQQLQQQRNDVNNQFSDMNQHDRDTSNLNPNPAFSPPAITVDFAPSDTMSIFPSQHTSNPETLSLPGRTPRGRSHSESHHNNFSRESSPAKAQRHRSASLQSQFTSRSPTPAPHTFGVEGARESSSPPVPADATIPTQGRPKKKNPAPFKCPMCSKSFTRRYNLHSHERTHTNERPFVCGVCGKAFARQHDKNRHEGLHTGEKKYICRGTLADGTTNWGCGRRFARADALGRHFRSEAGRACIRPLFEEEINEREAAWRDQQNQVLLNNSGGLTANGLAMQPPQLHLQTGDMMAGGRGGGGMTQVRNNMPLQIGDITLPAALLQKYPALANMDWSNLGGTGGSRHNSGAGQDGSMDLSDGDASGYDASSYEDFDLSADEDGGGYASGSSTSWAYS